MRRRKGPGTAGDLVAISEPNIILIDSESSNVTQVGTWSRVEESEAVGGSYLQSNTANSKLTFSFKGSTLWIRFRFGPDCGKAKVEVDSLSVTIDLYHALELYKYVNVAVGLKENEEHNVTVTVLGEKNASSTDYYVKVDSFAYRLTEEALSLHSIEYIDLINVINTINRINQIELINNIANVSLIQTISDVHGISNIGNVDLIKNISNVELIEKIDKIVRIEYVPIKEQIITNGDFETGDLSGWDGPTAGLLIDDTTSYRGTYSCRISPGYWIQQAIGKCYGDEIIVDFALKGEVGGEKLEVMLIFMDGTTEAATFTALDVWDGRTWSPTTHKIVRNIRFTSSSDNTTNIWVDYIRITGITIHNVDTVNKVNTISDITGVSAVGNIATLSQVMDVLGISTVSKVTFLSNIERVNVISNIELVKKAVVYGNTSPDGTGTDYALKVDNVGNVHIRPLSSFTDSVRISGDFSSTATVKKYLPLTQVSAGGTVDLWVPSSGKQIRLKRFQISVSGATAVTLQWSGATAVTDFETYNLPDKGCVVVNLVGCNEKAPGPDYVLRLKSSATAFITAKVSGEED